MANRKRSRRTAKTGINYVNVAVLLAVMAVLAASAYYYLSANAQPPGSTTTFPSTTFMQQAYGANTFAPWKDISPDNPYALNLSYMNSSMSNYSQVQATQYITPLWYGPGMMTAYDSMLGNPQFEVMAHNGIPIGSIAAQYPNTILEMWAYTGTFNTSQNANGLFDYMYSLHTSRGQSVPSEISPRIADRSVMLTYNALYGEMEPMELYMIMFVQNSTFVQIGAWMPKNSSSTQAIEIARAYERKIAGIPARGQ
ncbi:MAG: hypothetical protein KGH69_04805 [Candidatus Micrarchaeota archaeon]|nr:hypothetical protein [Candidatus Micrarchaeota archaeon]